MNDEKCPQCGSGTHFLLGHLGDVDWFRCRQCGWQWTVPNEETVTEVEPEEGVSSLPVHCTEE
jgi:transposase-like protein